MKKAAVIKFLSNIGLYNFVRGLHIKMQPYIWNRKYKTIRADYSMPLPQAVTFEPTFRCNLNCQMCFYKKAAYASKELAFDKIKNIFDKLYFIKEVNLIGGEPFMRRDIFEILDYFRKRGISLVIGTNGTLINKKNIKELEKNDNIMQIGTSIDGPKEVHNKIRGAETAFDNVIKGINLMKKKYFVFVVCVIQKDNLDKLEEVVSIVKNLGLKNVTFEYERRYIKRDIEKSAKILNASIKDFPLSISKVSNPGFSFDELKHAIEKVEKKGKGLGIKINYLPKYFKKNLKECYKRSFGNNRKYFCRELFRPRIDSEGNVFHCFAVRKIFGNVLQQSFEEIWNSKEYKDFRKRLLTKNLLPICGTCLYRQEVRWKK